MMRATLGLATILLLAACGVAEADTRQDLEYQIAMLEAQLLDARDQADLVAAYADVVEAASSRITATAASFDEDNWRIVVPEVQTASSNLERAASSLSIEADSLIIWLEME
jgi:hypothetical protein